MHLTEVFICLKFSISCYLYNKTHLQKRDNFPDGVLDNPRMRQIFESILRS